MITDDLEMVQSQVTMAQDDPEYTELLFKESNGILLSLRKRETSVPFFLWIRKAIFQRKHRVSS